jgi:hypothetical protein
MWANHPRVLCNGILRGIEYQDPLTHGLDYLMDPLVFGFVCRVTIIVPLLTEKVLRWKVLER